MTPTLVDQSEASIDQSEALGACFVHEGINNEQIWTKFARTQRENSNFPLTRVVQLVVLVQKTLAGRKVFREKNLPTLIFFPIFNFMWNRFKDCLWAKMYFPEG